MTQFKLRQMDIIKKIFENKSISRAADSMGLTTAAVSKACGEFETTMGITLFHRTRNGVVPTEICKAVVDSTTIIQDELKLLSEKIIISRKGAGRPIKVGFQEGPGNSEIFRALKSTSLLENDRIGFYNQERGALLQGLKADIFDIIILASNSLYIEQCFIEAHLYSYGCFAVSGNQCYSLSCIFDSWHIFGKKTWALLPVGYAIRDEFEASLKERKLSRPDKIIEYNSRLSLKEIANIYDICAIIPDYAKDDLKQFRNVVGCEEVEADLIINVSMLFKSGYRNTNVVNYIIEQVSILKKPKENRGL